ncbi:hypothetical protein FM107_19385 [Sphingobacterium sp. JB170]|nr:hypothetical protein FM107_19385 [Sphingobacterium sp. JB170]
MNFEKLTFRIQRTNEFLQNNAVKAVNKLYAKICLGDFTL